MVTIEDCQARHRNAKASIAVFIGVIVTGVGWAVLAGYGAESSTRALAEEVHVHIEVEAERDKHMQEDITEIKDMLKGLCKHQMP